jgi:hypothetical protein
MQLTEPGLKSGCSRPASTGHSCRCHAALQPVRCCVCMITNCVRGLTKTHQCQSTTAPATPQYTCTTLAAGYDILSSMQQCTRCRSALPACIKGFSCLLTCSGAYFAALQCSCPRLICSSPCHANNHTTFTTPLLTCSGAYFAALQCSCPRLICSSPRHANNHKTISTPALRRDTTYPTTAHLQRSVLCCAPVQLPQADLLQSGAPQAALAHCYDVAPTPQAY